MLLIVDDIQMGIGRTGPFFSFEPAGIVPDIVTLSKSLSGYGLPLSLTLLKPEHDQFEPGEHNGTFRGHNPAFVTGAASLSFWEDGSLERQIGASSEHLDNALMSIAATVDGADVKGRGLARGISFDDPALASATVTAAFERGLMVETTGAESEVVKLFPPINVSREELDEGIAIMGDAVDAVANAVPSKQARS
jgi:diaminobutyrate-2-oxoglutarate transaminase